MGPLHGLRVVEMAGLGPGPFGAMILADYGADVVSVEAPERPGKAGSLDRGKRQVQVDVKTPAGLDAVLDLVAKADVFIEPWRPGVADRLGLGPVVLCETSPRLVYVRMTGWGQTGPLAERAGHDINYIGLAGALGLIGRASGAPVAPPALLGDMAGGGLVMVAGVLAALYERERSGLGQVVDAAMLDGAALLTTAFHGFRAAGEWSGERGDNLLDGGSYYDVHETADGQYVAVGPIEPQFFAILAKALEIDPASMPPYLDRRGWQPWRDALAERFRRRTREEWTEVFSGSDACVTPVLSPWEAHEHPHNAERGVFIDVDGVRQPGPAPRFGRTPSAVPAPLQDHGRDVDAVLAWWT